MKRTLISVFLFSLLLTSCIGGNKSGEIEKTVVSASSRIGVASAYVTSMRSHIHGIVRPSPTMGIFTSSYLAQGAFIVVKGAMQAIQAQQLLIIGQTLPATSETFSLLQELGIVLQVDIVDVLNRADNRGKALDEYITSLKGVGNVAQRKKNELEQQETTLKSKQKDEKATVRELESSLREIFRNEDYGRAASVQEELTEANSKLAETEAKLDQTQDILDRFDELLDIAQERLTAIDSNREVLIAGLKVLEVPGIEDLDILDEGRSFRRSNSRKNRDNGGNDIFGAGHLE